MSTDRQWLDLELDGLDAARADRVRAFRLLMMAGGRLRTLLDKQLAPTGITSQQGAMLSWIQAQSQPPTVSATAVAMSMSHQNVKQIANALEKKGFLRIIVDAEDRRARRLMLTAKHHDFWRQRNSGDFSAIEKWTSAWTDRDVRQMVHLLVRLHLSLKSENTE